MCAAVPVAIFLLAVLAALTLTRIQMPASPNADLLVSQIQTVIQNNGQVENDFPNPASTRQAGKPFARRKSPLHHTFIGT